MAFKVPPAPVPRSHPRYEVMSRRADVHAFCRLVTRRDFPPAVLDDRLLDVIVAHIEQHGVKEGAAQFKAAVLAQHGMMGLALMRAAARNCEKAKAEGAPWAQ